MRRALLAVAAHGIHAQLQVWTGGHGDSYWHQHVSEYLQFLADSCA